MTFWDHLDALRGVLFRIVGVVIGLAIAMFFVMRWFFDHIIMWPCRADFPLYSMLSFMQGDGDFLPNLSNTNFSVKVINISLGTQLMTHLSASLWLAFAFSFPIIIYLLWSFVSPGLYENERRGARKAFLFGNIMFYLGVLVGYFVVFPLALRFLSQYQLSPTIENTLTLDSYMDNFYGIILAMGIVFELPLVAWLLGRIGLLKRSFFKKYRRHAIVALTALAAFITPTSDIFTLAIVFAPLYALWELSAFLVPSSTD
jgi:sec-independent protein translocase protein TatC